MDELRSEAEEGVENHQTLQQWLANQILESANYLSLQFTESVAERIWETIQGYKLETLSNLVNPVGRTDEMRWELREAGEKILRPLQALNNEMVRVWDQMSE